MGSPIIFNGSRAKLLTSAGILTQAGRTIDYDGLINYVANSGAEIDTTGWATYADAASATPVNGTGGSPVVTYTRTTSTPLDQTASFLFTKDAANRQGEGASYDFTVDTAKQGRVLSIEFDYQIASGTFATADMTVWIYDVTNSVIISPAPINIENTTTYGKWQGVFQTNINSTSYRLIFHVSSTSASAYTVKIDNVFCGPQVSTLGSIETDWTQYSPTIVGLGTVTGAAIFWKQMGDTLLVRGNFTSGTATASTVQIPFPAGLTADTAIGGAGENVLAGELVSSLTAGLQRSILAQRLLGYFQVGAPGEASTSGLQARTGSDLGLSSVLISFFGQVKITGWSSNTVVSSQGNTRVISSAANAATTLVNNSEATVIFTNITFDTNGAYNNSTGVYTVQVPGKYNVSSGITTNAYSLGANEWDAFKVRKNSATILDQMIPGNGAAAQRSGVIASQISCNAGDTIDVRFASTKNVALNGSGAGNYLSIFLVSGPTQIAATDTVACRYYGATASLSGTYADVTFTTRENDSTGIYSGATASIPVAGRYRFSGQVNISGTSVLNQITNVQLIKNGSTTIAEAQLVYGGAITAAFPITFNFDDVQALSTDTFKIQAKSAITSPVISASNSLNFIQITRVGNY